MSKYKIFLKVIYALRKATNWIIMVLFMIMFLIVTTNVFTRKLFNSPIAWAGELSRYTFIGIIFLGAVIAMKEKGHIGMEFIVESFSTKIRDKIVFAMYLLVLFFLAVFVIASIRLVILNVDVKSSAMGLSMAIPYASLPLGGIGMFIELLIQILGISGEKEEAR